MRFFRLALAAALVSFGSASVPAMAAGAGDLLVAPTRVVLDGPRGTEVILNNVGAAPATYRISLELKRMTPAGEFEDIALDKANDAEKQMISMISYAPRRIVLIPNQPQSIRIGVRAPATLADGEYRAHMLFRAIPESRPVTAAPSSTAGVSITLTPIYGVTIPIIVRKGTLKATAAISNVKLTQDDGRPALSVELSRTGTRSTYGRIRVMKPGIAKPVFEARGIAVYTEVKTRTVTFAIDPTIVAQLAGPATVQYVDEPEAGGGVIAETRTVIR
jgi:hypothetical protein